MTRAVRAGLAFLEGEYMAVIAVLALIYVAFRIMFTRPKGGEIMGSLMWLIVGMIALSFAFDAASNFYTSLSPFYRVLFLILAVLVAGVIVFRMTMSKETWSEFLAHILYDVVVFVITAPFRFLGWVLRLLFRPRQLPRVDRSNEVSRLWAERSSHSRRTE